MTVSASLHDHLTRKGVIYDLINHPHSSSSLETARLAKEAAEQQLAAADKKDLEHAQLQLVEAAARYRAAQKLKGKR